MYVNILFCIDSRSLVAPVLRGGAGRGLRILNKLETEPGDAVHWPGELPEDSQH